jgi:hypothetical protein
MKKKMTCIPAGYYKISNIRVMPLNVSGGLPIALNTMSLLS